MADSIVTSSKFFARMAAVSCARARVAANLVQPVSERPVAVPRSTKSRHTVNDVLKQAGLPKAF